MSYFKGNQHVRQGSFKLKIKHFVVRSIFWLKRSMVTLAIGNVLIWAGIGLYNSGLAHAQVVVQTQQVVKEVPVTPDFPPILKKICTAESGWKQFTKNGDVIRNKITPSDIGICQLHETIWNDKARKLGYDIYTEEGNKDMAVWIFNHYGSDPWNSSKQIVNGWGK